MPYGYLGIAGTVGFIDIDEGAFEVTIVDLRTGAVELELTGPVPPPVPARCAARRRALTWDLTCRRSIARAPDVRQPAKHVVEVRAALQLREHPVDAGADALHVRADERLHVRRRRRTPGKGQHPALHSDRA